MGLLGRRGVGLAALATAMLCVLGGATVAQAGVFDELDKELSKVKGKIRTDGTLTVGQQETIALKGLPGKYRLAAYIEPPPSASTCFDFDLDGYCFPQPLFRVSGTPRFRSSRKGRATLTFVMPPAYEFVSFGDPLQSHPVYLVNGQTVHVDVETTIKRRVGNSVYAVSGSVAKAIAVVEVPPAP